MELGPVLFRQRDGDRQSIEGVLRTVTGVQDFSEHVCLLGYSALVAASDKGSAPLASARAVSNGARGSK